MNAMKPGAHLLAFAGTRTQHRMAVRIEDAGFEIRDMIAWVYGSGFPKSLDVSKAIDAAAGAEREVIGQRVTGIGTGKGSTRILGDGNRDITAPATDAAKKWNGWGTALKPSLEPITVARKPLDGTVAENVLKHGTGAINVDACRVGTEPSPTYPSRRNAKIFNVGSGGQDVAPPSGGRWPANLIHDGSDEVLAGFPDSKSTGGRTVKRSGGGNVGSGKSSEVAWSNEDPGYGDSGSAARFFYCAKVSRSERGDVNHHPTVKPVDLMCYLVRLVGRAGGTVLDPFMGSGTTGIACIREGMKFIGIERDERYFEIARKRLEAELAQGLLPLNDNQP
jgi:site-specific DNA-methyltransferase (adenine-specific)